MKEQIEFRDYSYVKPARPQQTFPKTVDFYHSDWDKRLYVYAKRPGVQAWQITTGRSRPSVLILVKGKYILVMHAPSVTATSKPQAEEMTEAYDLAAALVAAPVAIFGDLNVDLQSSKRLASLSKHAGAHVLNSWNIVSTDTFTHKSQSELDWALCNPTFSATVEVAEVEAKRPGKRRKRSDDDEEWDGGDLSATKSSDHVPVVLIW